MIVDWVAYTDITGDTFTAQAKAERNLARAQSRIEEITGRQFDKEERTESLSVVDGLVWPLAYPVESVSLPTGATVRDDQLSIVIGTTIWQDALADILPGYPAQAARPRVLVTSVGGYDALTPPPTGLVDVICELASRYNNPADTTTIPAGATSVGTAGQSVSGRLGGAASIPPTLMTEIKKFRHITARMP
jgi:hypothetical protein